MKVVKITKDIFVRDPQSGVRRQVFTAGDEVPSHIYNIALNTAKVLNPKDLPVEPQKISLTSFHSGTSKPLETKVLPEEPAEAETVPEPDKPAKAKKK